MKTRRTLRYLLLTGVVIAVAWTVLTLYVEREGPALSWSLGAATETKALIVFDADPFYNLDEKVCLSFGKALGENGWSVDVLTVAAAQSVDQTKYRLLVYCANTYNWRPDWAVTGYIREHAPQSNQQVIAITLGAGSTGASQKSLEACIRDSGGALLKSYSLWLWRPNDETKMNQPNVQVAEAMAYEWGVEVEKQLP